MTAYYFADLQAAVSAGMGYPLLPELGHDVGCVHGCISISVGLLCVVAVSGQLLVGQMAAVVLMSLHVAQFENCWMKPTLAFSSPVKIFIIACLV